MQEIFPGIFTWPWFSERHGCDFNGTLVLDAGGNLCIDPVEPGADAMAQLEKEGVARILLTNRSHVRAANIVQERTGARIAIHPADAGYACEQCAPIDAGLAFGECVGPLSIIGVPEKSPGELTLHDPLRRLRELDFDAILVGDGVPIVEGAHERLRELVASFPPEER